MNKKITRKRFIIFYSNQTPITVNGKEFLKNPSEYIDFKAPCYKILIGGFTTYASINPYDVYKENGEYRRETQNEKKKIGKTN